MRSLRRYHLGLRTDRSFFVRPQGARRRLHPWGHDGSPLPAVQGAGWRITFERIPLPAAPMMQVNIEPVLHAANRSVAQGASLLVYAAHCVLEGCPPASPMRGFAPYRPVPLDKAELRRLEAWERAELAEQGTMQTTGVEAACRFAGKLSRNLDGHYACLKLMMSFSDCALHPMDLHPRYGEIGFVQSRSTMNHLVWARAVVSAYGVIEELGLDVRTGGKPSVQDGKWNPDVLADLERRLQRNGINLAETIPWSVRGAPRALEKMSSERFLSSEKAVWARGPYVRDISVRIVDAINAASRLRSTVAAHKARALRSRLSAVDVHNVQMVARRLLMESFGEWRRYLDEDRPGRRASAPTTRRRASPKRPVGQGAAEEERGQRG